MAAIRVVQVPCAVSVMAYSVDVGYRNVAGTDATNGPPDRDIGLIGGHWVGT